MSLEIASRERREGYIQNSSLILIALASTFFSRLFETVGFPGIINFVHFAVVPVTVGIVLINSKVKNRYQIETTWAILFGLLMLLGVMLVSALLNQAGLVNIVLDFLLLGEPFLLLAAIVSIQFSPQTLKKVQTWVTRFCLINLFLAFLQHYIIVPYFVRYLRTQLNGGSDLVQGVFFVSGGGNTVSASISIMFGVYFFQKVGKAPLWLRVTLLLATLWQVIISDSKQAILGFFLAWVILALTKVQDIRKLLMYVIGIVLFTGVFFWCIENIEFFAPYRTYINPSWYASDSRTMQIKFASINIIPAFYKSPLNLWFGLGPGHTVGRLGSGLLEKYQDLLVPLGATLSPVGPAVWARFKSLAFGGVIGTISTFFSPFWGWAGIWGDLGLVGLGSYFYLGYLVWSKLCIGDFPKLILINLLIIGFVFTQLEEPGFMLFIAMILGLHWHENKQENSNLFKKSSTVQTM